MVAATGTMGILDLKIVGVIRSRRSVVSDLTGAPSLEGLEVDPMTCSVRFHGSVSPRTINTSASVQDLEDDINKARVRLE